jgi:hypothetical protein
MQHPLQLWCLGLMYAPTHIYTRSRAPFGRMCLMTYRLASLFLLLFSPHGVSAAFIYASIYALGVLFTYRLAGLLHVVLSS